MSEVALNDKNPIELEQLRRDFVIAMFSLLKGLSLYDINNAAIERPLHNFEKALNDVRALLPDPKNVEIRYQDNVLQFLGGKITTHFSIVEALKIVTESFEIALIESINFDEKCTNENVAEFFSKWALHSQVHQRPKGLTANIEHIQYTLIDPEKANNRLKTKSLLLSPTYALQRYFLLREHLEDFFHGISKNELMSQRKLRRELMELVEISRVAPYHLVALSLIRDLDVDPEREKAQPGLAAAVSQALATGLLAISLAKELHFSVREQVNIGLVGLMYNVGFLSQEAAAALKNDRLTPVEYKRVLDAQASGVYKLIRLQGTSRPVLERLIAVFEQTRGSNVKSVSLTLESRLLRLVSQYVALTSDRPFRDAYMPSEAVKILGNRAVGPQGGDLDPILYYVFVRFLGVFPMGSLCLLSTGEKALVFRPSGEKTGVPMVKIIPKDEVHVAQLLDLSHDQNIQILKTLDPKREGISISGYFFD